MMKIIQFIKTKVRTKKRPTRSRCTPIMSRDVNTRPKWWVFYILNTHQILAHTQISPLVMDVKRGVGLKHLMG